MHNHFAQHNTSNTLSATRSKSNNRPTKHNSVLATTNHPRDSKTTTTCHDEPKQLQDLHSVFHSIFTHIECNPLAVNSVSNDGFHNNTIDGATGRRQRNDLDKTTN